MLELALSVIDRVIALARGRLEGRRQLYREAIEPLFLDLVSVHGDYVRVFSEIQKLAATDDLYAKDASREADPIPEDEALKLVHDLVNERRLQLEPVREKLKALTQALGAEDLHDEEADLVRAIALYFEFATVSESHSAYTSFLELLSHVSRRRQIAKLASSFLDELRNNWSFVTEAYAAVRIAIAKLR